jgi:hypothetical protein
MGWLLIHVGCTTAFNRRKRSGAELKHDEPTNGKSARYT